MQPLLGLSAIAIVALVAAVAIGVAFVGGVIWVSLRGKEGKPDIPAGMRPGPADETLERRMTERHVGWSLVFVLFFSAWLPIYWLKEPTTNVHEEVTRVEEATERGARWFALSNEENPTGFGCARCHGPEAEGGTTSFTNDAGETIPEYPVPSLVDVCGRLPIETVEADGVTTVGIRDTIMQGREGTPMPSWSVRFQGPMNDQQIQDLIAYLVSIQTVPDDQNLCLNPALLSQPEPPSPGPTETPDDSASPGTDA